MKSEEEGVTSLAPSRGFWTAELCLGLPAEVDQHWSGGVAPSLTPLPVLEMGSLQPLQHKRGTDGDTS